MLKPINETKKPLSHIAALVTATSDHSIEGINVFGISQSSRDVVPGDLFIALPGG